MRFLLPQMDIFCWGFHVNLRSRVGAHRVVFGWFHVDLRGISHIARLEHLALGEPSPAYSTVVSLARPRPNYVTTEGGEETRPATPQLQNQWAVWSPGGWIWSPVVWIGSCHFTKPPKQSNPMRGKLRHPKSRNPRTFVGASWRESQVCGSDVGGSLVALVVVSILYNP